MALRSQERYVVRFPGSSGDYRSPESDPFGSVPGEPTGWTGPVEVSGGRLDALPVPWRYTRRGESKFGAAFDYAGDVPILHFEGTVQGGGSTFYPVNGPRSPAGTFGWYSSVARPYWAGVAYRLEMARGSWLEYDHRTGRWLADGVRLLFPREAARYPLRIWGSALDAFGTWWNAAQDAKRESFRALDLSDRVARELGEAISRMEASAADAIAAAEALDAPSPQWALEIAVNKGHRFRAAKEELDDYREDVADGRAKFFEHWYKAVLVAEYLVGQFGSRRDYWSARCR